MNLSAIPWTTAAVRVALEATGGNEAGAAWSIWNVMKFDRRLRDAILNELATEEVVWGPTVQEIEREQLRVTEGDAGAAGRMLREIMDPRENPELVQKVGREAGARLVLAFKAVVTAVATDWREKRR